MRAVLILAAAFVMALAFWGGARPASAHANLARAEPAPNAVLNAAPTQVIIWFTEPLEPSFSEVRVLNFQGRVVDNGDSVVDANDLKVMSVTLQPLPNGTYTVAWKNLSTVDGHRVRGSFVFSVGEPISGQLPSIPDEDSPLFQSPAEPVFRWLALLGALAVVGGLSFELLVWRPVLAKRGSRPRVRRLAEQLSRRSRRLTWLAIAALLVGSVAQLVIQASAIHESAVLASFGKPLASVVIDTDWGRLWLWRMVLTVIMAAVLGGESVAQSRAPGRAARLGTGPQALVMAIGVGVLFMMSMTSHGAATFDIRGPAILNDFLHLAAASLWAGGLPYLLVWVVEINRSSSGDERRSILAAVTRRFSVLAALSVSILIVTGLFGYWAQVTVIQALATPYGISLIAKVGIAAALLLVGAVNLLWIRPRLRERDRTAGLLARLVSVEVVLVVLVVFAVGFLTSLEPARQVASRQGVGQSSGLTFGDTVEGADITLEVDPGRVGLNRFVVSLADRFGRPIDNASNVSVRATFLDADLGEEALTAVHAGGGDYVVEDGLIGIVGPWQVEVAVRRPDAFDARTAFRFEVTGVTGGSGAISPSPRTGMLLLGVELAVLGVLFLAAGVALGGWYRRDGAAVMTPGIASFLAGAVLIFNIQTADTPDGVVRNPVPPNAASLEAGAVVYAEDCQTCHGPVGRGDGPAAKGLEPPPADLAVHVPLHSDGILFEFIRDGIQGTAMAPLGERLTDEEIWHVINYIKTFEE